MRLPAALAFVALAATAARASVDWIEFDAVMPVRSERQKSGGEDARRVAVTWAAGFPDTLARTDTRAILASIAPGKGQTLLPRGRLTAQEEAFVIGLRALMDGSPQRALEAWATLRGQTLPPDLAACLRANVALLRALAGDVPGAEALWLKEWKAGGPVAEGAWRNLLALRMAQGRWRAADSAIASRLAEDPHDRAALVAKAALLWRFRPEPEWAEFLRTRSEMDGAAPEIQLIYGEYLLRKKRLDEAVTTLDKALAKKPGSGRGWYLLAEAQYKQGYLYFALDCLQNAGRGGYAEPDFYELYARVLHACCTGDEDPRAVKARAAAQELLEKGLAKDLHRRSAAQLLYTLYAQNLKSDAAKALEKNLWFHFDASARDVLPLGDTAWASERGFDALGLRVNPGVYGLDWVLGMRGRDVYREMRRP
jgi:tetratricopeptide (TPR) repeat protein